MRAVRMGPFGAALALALLAGCAARPAVRCDAHLVPINPPPAKPAAAAAASAPSAPADSQAASSP